MGEITKKEFSGITGELPEDVLGNDWENEIEDFNSDEMKENEDRAVERSSEGYEQEREQDAMRTL